MSFTAVFKSVLKRTNSTQVPNMQQDSTTLSVVVLDATSVMTPRIRLSYAGNPTNWNYCMISEFGRYYFITDWTSDHNQWIATLNCDVLATYKQTILASQEYVLRSASSYDGTIFDTYYPAKAAHFQKRCDPKQTLTVDGTQETAFSPLRAGESFIVGIYGLLDRTAFGSDADYVNYVNNNTRGAITYYWFTLGELVALCLFLASDNSISKLNITDISQGLQKALTNPIQYIASVMAIPIDRPASGQTVVTALQYGWFGIVPSDIPYQGLTGFVLAPIGDYRTGCSFEFRELGEVKLHPQASRGSYLNCLPYTKCDLVFEPFGSIPIDLSKCPGALGLRANIIYEPIQGIATLDVYPYKYDTEGGQTVVVPDTKINLYHRESQIGLDVALNQLSVNNLQTMSGILGTAASTAGALVSGNLPGAIAGFTGGITSAIESQMPQNQTQGINGSVLQKWIDPYVYIDSTLVVDEDLSQLGRPLCQKVTLSTLSGYCLCRDADIKITGTTSESDQIKDFLNSGFFIE